MRLSRSALTGLTALILPALLACQEELPTAGREDFVPVDAVTVEVTLPFDEFAEDLEIFGGYGSPSQLAYGLVAHEYEDSLEARTLVGWWPLPEVATVRDSTGSSRPDSSLTFIGGRVVALFDTLASIHGDTVEMAVAGVRQPWHYGSVDWEVAVDTVGDIQPWDQPGGGEVIPLATSTWAPADGDSVVFELDSAAVALWGDSASAGQGIRLDALTEGVRLQAHTVRLFLETRPSSNPDTLVDLMVQTRYRSFIYQPVLEEPEGEFRVGGVPAWRAVFKMDFPTVLDGPAELCEKVECPLELTPESVNSASLFLTSSAPPAGFRPSDTLIVDVREVLQPERLPKSPLGSPLANYLYIPPVYFGDSVGARVEVPIGDYITSLIRGETSSGGDISPTMAILSALEPLSMPFGAFQGPGGPDEPILRLILTVGGGVEIR